MKCCFYHPNTVKKGGIFFIQGLTNEQKCDTITMSELDKGGVILSKMIGRLGEENKSCEGFNIKIIEYFNNKNIIVEILDVGLSKVNTTYKNFKLGKIRSPYHTTYFGVGYRGVGEYTMSNKDGSSTKAAQCWTDMLDRCYGIKHKEKYKMYSECYVDKAWHNFQNFAKWYYDNIYDCKETLNLDKDIKYKNNNIYSADTCLMVPQSINKHAICGNGCSWHKRDKIWQAYIIEDNKQRWLGKFDEKEAAHKVFLEAKNKYWQNKVKSWKGLLPDNVYVACKNKIFDQMLTFNNKYDKIKSWLRKPRIHIGGIIQ